MTRPTWIRAALCVAFALAADRAAAQASASEMAAFPMPPPSGFFTTKTFGYVGDYGYYTAPASSVPGTGAAASDYRYVRYRGVTGKRVFVYGAWGPTTIPAPAGGGDSCAHAHASWGVWGRWQFSFPFYGTISGWTFLGGGGMSGTRTSAGRCVLTPNNPLRSIDDRYGWGETFKSFDLRGQTFITELVVGALSNTHGWGSCTVPRGFLACHEPSYIIGYTLP
jgi:hypothetical protein